MTLLLRRNGWTTAPAEDVSQALSAVSNGEEFEAVIIDVHLPDGDGIELARKIRKTVGDGPRIVILSGDHSVTTLARLNDVGVDRFIGKPLSFDALLHALDGGGPTDE